MPANTLPKPPKPKATGRPSQPRSVSRYPATPTPMRQNRLKVPLIALVVLIGGIGIVAALRSVMNPNPCQDSFAEGSDTFCALAGYLPADAGLYVSLRTESLPDLQGLSESIDPVLGRYVSDIVNLAAQSLMGINLFETDWVGDQLAVAFTTFPASTNTTAVLPGAVIVADIDESEAATETLTTLAQGVLPGEIEQQGGRTLFRFTNGLGALVDNRALVLTSSHDALSRIGASNSLVNTPAFTTTLQKLSFSSYNLVAYADLSNELWASIGLANVQAGLLAYPYVAVGIAQPEPTVALVDFVQSPVSGQSTPIQLQRKLAPPAGNLLAFAPENSLLILQTSDIAGMYASAKVWAEQLGFSNTLAGLAPIVDAIESIGLGIDIEKDVIEWMTRDTVLFVSLSDTAPGQPSVHWGGIVEFSNDTASDIALERLQGRVSLLNNVITSAIPTIPIQLRLEPWADGQALVANLDTGSDTADLVLTSANDPPRWLIGSRAGVINASNTGTTRGQFTQYQPYLLPNAHTSAIIKPALFPFLDTTWNAYAQTESPFHRFDHVAFESIYIAVLVDEVSPVGLRVVLTQPGAGVGVQSEN